MTNEIARPENNEPSTNVKLEDGTIISMKTVQHLYNEITGRTEELSKSYDTNHRTTFDDLRQLHIKICQLQEQYNITSKNCSVTLYHLNDQKQVFSSFERFKLYDQATLSPVENIRLEYQFLIILPQTNKPQNYKVEINIHSRAAITQRAKLESSHAPPGFIIDILTTKTAHLEINYVDYTVARNFQNAIDEWFRGLPQSRTSPLFRLIQRASEHAPVILRAISTLAFLSACLHLFSPSLSNDSATKKQLYLSIIVALGGASVLSLLTGRLGSSLSGALRRIKPLSYLSLTRGDERAIDQLQAGNHNNWIKSILSLAGALLINIGSTWLASKIGLK